MVRHFFEVFLFYYFRFGLGRKPASELSPGSRKMMSALVNPQGQPSQQSLGQMPPQNFNIQVPKSRKTMVSTKLFTCMHFFQKF